MFLLAFYICILSSCFVDIRLPLRCSLFFLFRWAQKFKPKSKMKWTTKHMKNYKIVHTALRHTLSLFFVHYFLGIIGQLQKCRCRHHCYVTGAYFCMVVVVVVLLHLSAIVTEHRSANLFHCLSFEIRPMIGYYLQLLFTTLSFWMWLLSSANEYKWDSDQVPLLPTRLS